MTNANIIEPLNSNPKGISLLYHSGDLQMRRDEQPRERGANPIEAALPQKQTLTPRQLLETNEGLAGRELGLFRLVLPRQLLRVAQLIFA